MLGFHLFRCEVGSEQDTTAHPEWWGFLGTGWERPVPGQWLKANVNRSRDPAPRRAPVPAGVQGARRGPSRAGTVPGSGQPSPLSVAGEGGRGASGSDARFKAFYLIP